jgi:tetratricopeptide (TPR) repeat protein
MWVFGRSATMSLVVLALSAAAFGQASLDEPCSVAALEKDAASTLDACSSVLSKSDLSAKSRADALKIRARSLRRLGRNDNAISDYDEAFALAPNDPEIFVGRGYVAYEKGDLTDAFTRAFQALLLDSRQAAAFDVIALVWGRLGDFPKAARAIDQAVALEPNDPGYHWNRYYLLMSFARQREALEEADVILKMPLNATTKPSSLRYYGMRTSFRTAVTIDRAALLAAMGRFAEAESGFNQAVAEDQGPLAYAWRASFHLYRSAPYDLVQADLSKSLSLAPDSWFARDLQGRVYFYTNHYEAAVAELTRAIKLKPDHGASRWWRALALRKLHQFDDASADAWEALAADSGFLMEKVGVLQKRGYLQASLESPELWRALGDAVRACMLDEECW